MQLDERFFSRKFMLSAGIQTFSSIALIQGWLTSADYMQISVVNIGTYNIANAGVHVFGTPKEQSNDPSK